MNPSAQQQVSPIKAKRRQYDEQFKRDAVALMEGGRGATQLARELGVSQWNLRDWKELYGATRRHASRTRCRHPPARHFKKSLGHRLPGTRERYSLIDDLRLDLPSMNIREACHTLAVSPGGYYAHQHKGQRQRRVQDAALSFKISAAFDASRHTYGSPRIMHTLRNEGACHGKNRIARLMRSQGLQVQQKRRFVPRTTVADKNSPVAPNHLLKHPEVTRLNEVWLTDITYLPTAEGFLYLAAELDLFSRRIIGWSTHTSLATELTTQAFERALQARPGATLADLLHHSDRGCQYTSTTFRQRLSLCQITQSMSRKGNCYDNAAMESSWATLKAECFGTTLPAARAQAHLMVFDYIETFYNPVRLHSALRFQSPVDFEKSFQLN